MGSRRPDAASCALRWRCAQDVVHRARRGRFPLYCVRRERGWLLLATPGPASARVRRQHGQQPALSLRRLWAAIRVCGSGGPAGGSVQSHGARCYCLSRGRAGARDDAGAQVGHSPRHDRSGLHARAAGRGPVFRRPAQRRGVARRQAVDLLGGAAFERGPHRPRQPQHRRVRRGSRAVCRLFARSSAAPPHRAPHRGGRVWPMVAAAPGIRRGPARPH